MPECEPGKVEKLSIFPLKYIPLSRKEGKIQRTSGNVQQREKFGNLAMGKFSENEY